MVLIVDGGIEELGQDVRLPKRLALLAKGARRFRAHARLTVSVEHRG
jgi:hypothetical protein